MGRLSLSDRPRIEIDDVIPPEKHAKAYALALRVAEELHDQYPHHPWRVYPSSDNTVIYVLNDLISTRWSYVIHTGNIGSEAELQTKVRQMGGEFLERYNVPREKADIESYAHLFGRDKRGAVD